VPFDVTLGDTSQWNATVHYVIRLQDPAGATTVLADVPSATIPAAGSLTVPVSFPASPAPGPWILSATVIYSGPVKASGCGTVRLLSARKTITAG
jgi:hypothetical protein